MQSSLVTLAVVVLGITGTFGFSYPKDKLYRGSAEFGVGGLGGSAGFGVRGPRGMAGLGFDGGSLDVVDGFRGYGQFGGLNGGPGYNDGIYGGIGGYGPGILDGGLYGGRSHYYGYPGYSRQYNNIPYGRIYNTFGSYGYGIDGAPYGIYGGFRGLNNFGINGRYYGGKKSGKY